MEFKINCIVLHVRPYRMIDDKTGVVNEGVSLQYLTSDNLNPTAEERDKSKGYKPCKDSLPIELASKLTEVPALYEFSMSMATNKDGKPQMKLRDVTFVSTFGKK